MRLRHSGGPGVISCIQQDAGPGRWCKTNSVGQLWDLWSRWLSGQSVSNASLWGTSVLWWGRWGKILIFAAGLTVVLDLIGPERLKAFGEHMKVLHWRTAGKQFEKPTNVLAFVVVAVFLIAYIGLIVAVNLSGLIICHIPDLKHSWANTWRGSMLIMIVWFAMAFVLAGAFSDAGSSRASKKTQARWAFIFAPAVFIILALLAVVLLPWLAFIYLVLVPAARGLAWLLDRKSPAHPARWLAVAMFIVGSFFDLLAS